MLKMRPKYAPTKLADIGHNEAKRTWHQFDILASPRISVKIREYLVPNSVHVMKCCDLVSLIMLRGEICWLSRVRSMGSVTY